MTEQAAIGARREAGDLEMIRGARAVVDLLAGKWSVDVLYLLASGTRRYSEVFYEVGEISKKTLTQTLRTLERDGLIARRVYADVPARVEYSLTALGWSLTEPLMAMYEWAATHLQDVDTARLLHDGPGPPARALAAA
jgi:DNA-binding HxlR family transcriptional regulator